jgi:hypothetical protein
MAKSARPAYLGDVYGRVAIRYLFMAEETAPIAPVALLASFVTA